MKKYRLTAIIVFLIFSALMIAAPSSFGEDIKARMKARLPAIDALKAQGIVGENNRGFLEFRGAPRQADILGAENADRKAVYEAIAAQTGITPELVGSRRAIQIREVAKPGEWLQDESGKWYRR